MLKEPIWVVAGALKRSADCWLMHQRPLEKHHGGLWEFPGGKVEDTEIPVKALIRELKEELGVVVHERHCSPFGFAEERSPKEGRSPIVILLYKIEHWEGDPRALEGGEVDWFTPQAIAKLEKPPLDRELAQALLQKND